MPGCETCPFRDSETTCWAMARGHRRTCRTSDPGHPDHIPGMREKLIRMTEGSFPPLATQAANLAGAVVRFVASGGEMATEEEKARRLAICHDCDRFEAGRCRECGCRLVAKIAMASEHCPVGKW